MPGGDDLQTYRDAVARAVHAVCVDRNLDPASVVDTEAGCRIEQFLPRLVALAKGVGPGDPGAFNAVVEEAICPQCGHLDAGGTCRVRQDANCCLYRYLPLLYEAIHSVKG